MTDYRIRQLTRSVAANRDRQTQAALIISQIRSGTYLGLGPRETACHTWEEGEQVCVACHGRGGMPLEDCSYCEGTSILPLDPMDTVRLRAYWGCEASRLVLEWHNGMVPCWVTDGGEKRVGAWFDAKNMNPGLLATGLLSLAAELPPLRLVGGVECCVDLKLDVDHNPPCAACRNTGRKPYSVPMNRWVAVKIRVAVGKAYLLTLPTYIRDPYICPLGGYIVKSESSLEWQALDAAAAWVRCPCLGNAEAAPVFVDNLPDWVLVPYQLSSEQFPDIATRMGRALASASKQLNEKTIHEVIQGAR